MLRNASLVFERVKLHFCNEQEVKCNIAGAQIHYSHLLL
jgi:hypothetical protein